MRKWIFPVLCLLFVCLVSCALAENNDMGSATAIRINTYVDENISGGDDVDYFKFTLPSRGYISVSFSHDYVDEGDKWTVQILNANNAVFVEQSFQGRTQTEVTTCDIGLEAGTWYVKVAPYSRYYPCSAAYQFKVNFTATNTWEREFNQNAGSANSIDVNTKYGGCIAYGDDVDFYTFTLDEAGYVSLAFSHEYVNDGDKWTMDLLNINSASFVSRSFSGRTTTETSICKIGLPKGQYYVRVKAYSWYYPSSANYYLTVKYTPSEYWEREFNGDLGTQSTPIEPNKSYSGSIAYGDDVDNYKIKLPAAGHINLDFKHDYQDSGERWNVRVLNENSSEYFSWTFEGRATTTLKTYEYGLPAGTYYIQVRSCSSYYTFDGTYTFTVNYKATDLYETEWNNTPVSADAYKLGKKVSGNISNGNDLDYYKVEITKDRLCNFLFQHNYNNSIYRQWTVSIIDENNSTIASWDYTGDYTAVTRNSVSLSKGIYYILVKPCSSFSSPTQEYTIQLLDPYDRSDLPTRYSDRNGTYKRDGDTYVYQAPAPGATSVVIPDSILVDGEKISVTAIADRAFKGNRTLTTVKIGKNVTVIGRRAFYGCTALKTVKGGSRVTTIRDSAFQGCRVLKTFPVMNKLKTIGASAFKGCAKLPKFTLGTAVNSIGKYAFNGCKALKLLTVKTRKLTAKNVKAGAFKGIYSKAVIKCPKNKAAAYKKIFVKKGASKKCRFK